MKIYPDVLRGAFPVLVAIIVLAGCATGSKGGNATVEFRDPDRFSDLQLPGKSREQTVAIILPQLQEEVDELAKSSIPAGDTVHLYFTEIDQAGYIHNPGGAFPIRITGDNTPAVIAFDYSITGPTGVVIKSGQQRLAQTSENLQPFLDDDSPAPLIEYMLNNWLGSVGWELSHSAK